MIVVSIIIGSSPIIYIVIFVVVTGIKAFISTPRKFMQNVYNNS